MVTFSNLPVPEEGLFTLNVAKAVDITMSTDNEQMRGTHDSQFSFMNASQLLPSVLSVCESSFDVDWL